MSFDICEPFNTVRPLSGKETIVLYGLHSRDVKRWRWLWWNAYSFIIINIHVKDKPTAETKTDVRYHFKHQLSLHSRDVKLHRNASWVLSAMYKVTAVHPYECVKNYCPFHDELSNEKDHRINYTLPISSTQRFGAIHIKEHELYCNCMYQKPRRYKPLYIIVS